MTVAAGRQEPVARQVELLARPVREAVERGAVVEFVVRLVEDRGVRELAARLECSHEQLGAVTGKRRFHRPVALEHTAVLRGPVLGGLVLRRERFTLSGRRRRAPVVDDKTVRRRLVVLHPGRVALFQLYGAADVEELVLRHLLIVFRNLPLRLPLRRGIGGVLVRAEGPGAVLPDRSATGERVHRVDMVELHARQRRAGDLARRRVLHVPVVVQEDVLGRALEPVGARLGDHVDDRALRAAVLGGNPRGVHRHFLNRLEVQVRAEGARRRVGCVDRVDDEEVVARQRTHRVDVARADNPGHGADERLIAAAHRNFLELLAAHARVRRRVGDVHDRRVASHLHGGGQRTDFHDERHRRRFVRLDHVAGGLRGVEALKCRGHQINANRHRWEQESAVLVGDCRPRKPAILARDGHGHAWHHAAGCVLGGARNCPGLNALRETVRRPAAQQAH